MRLGVLVIPLLMLAPESVCADVVADSCGFYRASERHESNDVREISALHGGDVIRICKINNQLTDYFVLSKIDEGPVGLCHYVERRVFKPFKASQRWTFLPPKSAKYLAEPVDLMFASREPCPSPSSPYYTRVADVGPGLVLRFLSFWNNLMVDEALQRDQFESISAAPQQAEFYKKFLNAVTQSCGREVELESFGPRHDNKSRYQAIARAHGRLWLLIFDMRGNRFVINDVHSIIE